MGVLIVAESPPAGGPYDKWICYRSDTQTGEYLAINGATGQVIADLTYYDTTGTSSKWYKISYYNTSGPTESAKSDPMQGLSETYTTVAKVKNFLNLSTISDSTTPSIQQVIELINRAEDSIDYITGHAWRVRYSNTASGLDQTPQYEYHDVDLVYEDQSGIPVYLDHRQIKQMASASGDVFEIYDGNAWVDWLAYTEGRANDWWMDYGRGILYVKTWYGVRGPQKLRIKYRYGENMVNRLVEDIATKMVAKDLLLGESRAAFIPEGGANLTFSQKVEILNKDIDDQLMRVKEIRIPGIHL